VKKDKRKRGTKDFRENERKLFENVSHERKPFENVYG